jgi:hypothetical protein
LLPRYSTPIFEPKPIRYPDYEQHGKLKAVFDPPAVVIASLLLLLAIVLAIVFNSKRLTNPPVHSPAFVM